MDTVFSLRSFRRNRDKAVGWTAEELPPWFLETARNLLLHVPTVVFLMSKTAVALS
jgi:hypothetical protein